MKELKVSPIFYATLAYLKVFKIIAHQGGTRSGKTYNTVWALIFLANSSKESLQISIVSRDLPHLKRGAMKDFLEIMKDKLEIFDKNQWNATDKKYTFNSGCIIEFFSIDDEGKARGSNRDILFINECNSGIKYDIWFQLSIRTRRKIIIDYNPSHSKHWIYEEVLKREDCKLIISTYRDNFDFLPIEQIQEIERMKEENPAYWRVFGEGQRGMALKGRVFENWKEIEYNKFPRTQRIFGLDFGFTNDPTTLIEGRKTGKKVFVKEHIYQTGLTTPQLVDLMRECGVGYNDVIYADNSEPRLIQELRQNGFNIIGAKKGSNSIIDGINYIKSLEVFVDYKSSNLLNEYSFYKWHEDKRKFDNSDKETKFLNNPIDFANHAMDAFRYLCEEWRGLHGSQSLSDAMR